MDEGKRGSFRNCLHSHIVNFHGKVYCTCREAISLSAVVTLLSHLHSPLFHLCFTLSLTPSFSVCPSDSVFRFLPLYTPNTETLAGTFSYSAVRHREEMSLRLRRLNFPSLMFARDPLNSDTLGTNSHSRRDNKNHSSLRMIIVRR